MAHPSDTLPKSVYILNSSNALNSTTGLGDNKRVFAITNPTASPIDASCIGSNFTYQTNAYKQVDTAQTIAVQPGATIYGSWTSVAGAAAGLLCYVG